MTLGFKVGDVVKLTEDGAYELGYDIGAKGTIIQAGHRLNGEQWMNYVVRFQDGETEYVRSKWITLCRECNNNRTTSAGSSEDMGFVGSAVEKVRALAMSTDDRLLRQYGVVDECGNVTEGGKALLLELLFADNKDSVVAKLKEIDAEAEKKAKKSK